MKGSTRRRGSTWTAYWSVKDLGTGKRVQHSRGGFRTQRLAQEHLTEVLAKVNKGEWRPDTQLTVQALLLEHWLPSRRASLRPSTVSLYRRAVENWIVPNIGAVELRRLVPATADQLAAKLATSGGKGGMPLSPRSVQIAVGTLMSATRWAAKTGLVGRDPLTGHDRPTASSPEMKAWTAEEARRFLGATSGDRLAFVYALLLTRGMRRGEVCGLRWEDIDLEGGYLRVVRTRVLVDGRPQLSEPKTKAGRRSVPLDPKLVALLRRHKAQQAAEKLAAGTAYHDAGWLVADELGRPYYPDAVSGMFDRQVQAAGLRKIRVHDTRHTAATLMLSDGVPVKTVADLLGHDPRVTLATYAHAVPGLGEAAGAALSERLLG